MPTSRSAEQALQTTVTELGGTDADVSVPGQRRRTGKGHIQSYGRGRVCEAPGCVTELSRYNSGGACWLHDQDRFLVSAGWGR